MLNTILHVWIYGILSKFLELIALSLFPSYRCRDSKWHHPGQDLYTGSLILKQHFSIEIESKPQVQFPYAITHLLVATLKEGKKGIEV